MGATTSGHAQSDPVTAHSRDCTDGLQEDAILELESAHWSLRIDVYFRSTLRFWLVDRVSSTNREEAGFMTYTAARPPGGDHVLTICDWFTSLLIRLQKNVL